MMPGMRSNTKTYRHVPVRPFAIILLALTLASAALFNPGPAHADQITLKMAVFQVNPLSYSDESGKYKGAVIEASSDSCPRKMKRS